ncbi:siphovirus ReqiPepy6 Gp37-like family protein [Halalkalibacterium ligniniphilum]|uniref:siphovirus ReqiPepy6 Gp37-like family protein n=1 Tax=Halalkalibacterium ligniniphilum TaxID=1134413 RepID=UPI00034516EA|nr:siphovirus ReqiPepy6 Gp37-like family protein [Halalkalibacterium ligniniphilum]
MLELAWQPSWNPDQGTPPDTVVEFSVSPNEPIQNIFNLFFGAHQKYYEKKGVRVSPPLNINRVYDYRQSAVTWVADVPPNTDLLVEVSTDNENWLPIENGDPLPIRGRVGGNVYTRQTFITKDPLASPRLHTFNVNIKGSLTRTIYNPRKVGLIKYREVGIDENGMISEQLIIKGPTLKGILDVVTNPPSGQGYDSLTANAETIMKRYVQNNLITPENPNRKIEQVANAPDGQRGLSLFYQTRYKSLLDELEKLSLTSGLGWFMYLDTANKKWVFDVEEGKDLTSTNTAGNNPVIFSADFDNIKGAQFVNSDLDYKNVAYVAGQGEGAERRVVVVGDAKGLERHELFVDARDIEETDENGDPIPVAEIDERLKSRGLTALAERNREKFFESQILTDGPFKYEKDWNLGDVVTTQVKKWGVTLDARITEVREIYQPSGFQLEVVFGHSMPTLIEKIKQELSNMSIETRR